MTSAEKLQLLEPFGAGNPEPKIVIENVKFSRASIIGNGHVKCFLTSDTGGSLKAIAFRCADTEVGKTMLNARGEKFNVIGVLHKDVWQGNASVQFIIEDIARA